MLDHVCLQGDTAEPLHDYLINIPNVSRWGALMHLGTTLHTYCQYAQLD